MKGRELVFALLQVAEKAANLARSIRSEETLFELLVEEKKGESRNKRFVQDFKTLADVLVQETVKHDLAEKFPSIVDCIHGEEDNLFQNALGERVVVEIKSTVEETAQLLSCVLEGNTRAANLLAKAVHQDVILPTTDKELEVMGDLELSTKDIAVWVDPIDSTAQYISGEQGVLGLHGVFERGLPCVLVLIGVYELKTGAPILGVVNQPFSVVDADTKQWTGRVSWGISCNGTSVNSLPHKGVQAQQSTTPRVVMSTSDSQAVRVKLQEHHDVVFAAGAGYKILCCVDKLVDAYALTRGSTYKWDTCSPHAILKSLGGGIVDYERALDVVRQHSGDSTADLSRMMLDCQLKYNVPDSADLSSGQKWLNSRGLVAYTDPDVLVKLLKALL